MNPADGTARFPARPSRRVILLTNIKRTTMRLGAVTQAFFRKGEELEATGFENVPPDDPTLVLAEIGEAVVPPLRLRPPVIARDQRDDPDFVRFEAAEVSVGDQIV